jgi:hypothetical protein
MSVHRKGRPRKRILLLASLATIATGLVFAIAASTASLPGSNFEIEDSTPATLPGANLKVDGTAPPALDWANVSETRKADLASGSGDNSFVQGTKEDTAVPVVETGSIPPNKSDLLNMGFYLEESATERNLNLFWHRVQEPNGTTNMDFEFNKSSTLSANGITPVRTAGDVLIQYDLSRGGTNPTLFASRWITGAPNTAADCEASNALPCWNKKVDLTAAGIATGSINNVAIPVAESDGLATDITGDGNPDPISPRTFGEAQVDLNALTGGSSACAIFGSAYLKSRSSDSFVSALKDFIAPVTLDLDQCASVIIRKVTIPASDPAAVRFGYTPVINTEGTDPGAFTLGHGQAQEYNNVLFGNGYTVVEDVLPTNWEFVSLDCSASTGVTPAIAGAQVTFDINDAADVLDCTYTNRQQLGAIRVTKTRKHAADGPGPHPHAGVSFTIAGQSVTTDANGQACVDGLTFGSYDAVETLPSGYSADQSLTQSATVNNQATCSDSPYVGEELAFGNTPLSDVTISVNSQVDGGTNSTIVCDNGGPNGSSGTNGDASASVTGVEPVVYNCVITVDP